MPDTEDALGVALCIGIADYHDPALASLPATTGEVAIVRNALAESGFVIAEPLIGACTWSEIHERLRAIKVPRSGRLLVYWTGHGVSRSDGSYLLTTDSRLNQLDDSSCMTPRGLSDALHAIGGATQIVLILDCCAAGTVAVDVANAIYLSRGNAPVGRRRAATISLIAATFGAENVDQLQFADAVAAALRLGSPTLPWPAQLPEVPPQDLAVAAGDWMFKHGGSDLHHARSVGIEAGTPFFRNPLYSPYATDIQLDDKSTVRRDGVLTSAQSWRTNTSNGLLLISGAMGTGKSTVMRQLAAATFGPVRIYSVNLAPGRDLEHIVKVLTEKGLGLLAPADVVTSFATKGESIVLLLDSLDEAAAADLLPIVTQLVVPLSSIPGVHVIAAVRRGVDDEAMAALGDTASRTIDLDTDREAHGQIVRHAMRILTSTPGSPYAEERGLSERAAEVIADRSAGVFLFADRVANALAREVRALDPAAFEFQAVLRSGIGGAIKQALDRLSDRPDRAVDVLTPLAFAVGSGLPRTVVWMAMATALLIRPGSITDDDIRHVLAAAGSFVLAETEQGRIVYRLRHQAYGTFLRSRMNLDPVTIQRRIFAALRLAPGTWGTADPYVLRYLVVHAQAAGKLDELVEDEDFLIHADSRTTLPVVSHTVSDRTSNSLAFYLMAGPLLHDCSPQVRAFTIASLRARAGERESRLPTTVRPVARTLWSTSPKVSRHRLIRIGTHSIEALAAAPVDNGWVLIAAIGFDEVKNGKLSGSIELWDPATATHLQTLRRKDPSEVNAMTTVAMPSDSFIVVSYHDRVLEAWSLRLREPVWSHDVQTNVLHLSVIRSRQGEVLLGIVSGGEAMLWEPQSGRLLHDFRPGGGVLFAIAFSLPDANVLCFGTDTGYLEFYDADSFAALGQIRPDEVWAGGVATEVRGRLVLIGSLESGRMEVRDARDRRVLALSRSDIDSDAEVLAVVRAPGGDPLVVRADEQSLTLWSTSPLKLSQYRYGHLGRVMAIEVMTGATGNCTLATAGWDGTIRTWLLTDRANSVSYTLASSCLGAWYLPGDRPAVLADRMFDYAVLDVAGGALRYTAEKQQSNPGMASSDPVDPSPTGLAILRGAPMFLTYHDGTAQHLRSVQDDHHYAVPTDPYDPMRVGRIVVMRRNASPVFVIGDGGRLSVYEFNGQRVSVLAESDGGMPLMSFHAGAIDGVIIRVGDFVHLYDVANGARIGGFAVESTMRGQRAPTVLAAIGSLDGGTVTVVVNSPNGMTHLQAMGETAGRCEIDGDHSVAAALTIGGIPVLALADGNRLVLVRPRDGKVVESIPFESYISDLVPGSDGEVIVHVGNCLSLLALDECILQ